jgi:flagellar biosynthesis/type III secretory pathway protein FliH
MSSLSDRRPRVNVMRAANVTRDNVTTADITTVRAPAARDLVVDRRLIDEALADGYRAGYEVGFATGLDDAAQAAVGRERERAVQLHSVVSQLTVVADELRRREGTAVERIETELAQAAFRIAEALLGHELSLTKTPGRDAITRALQFAPKDGMVSARLHPDDADTLGDLEAAAPGRALTIVRDTSIQPGNCVVEVAGCRVESLIDAALERVRELLGTGVGQ